MCDLWCAGTASRGGGWRGRKDGNGNSTATQRQQHQWRMLEDVGSVEWRRNARPAKLTNVVDGRVAFEAW